MLYTQEGAPMDNARYKKLVESIVDKKRKMEELLREVMAIEEDLIGSKATGSAGDEEAED